MSFQKYESGTQENVRDWVYTLGIINGGDSFSHAYISDHPRTVCKRTKDDG